MRARLFAILICAAVLARALAAQAPTAAVVGTVRDATGGGVEAAIDVRNHATGERRSVKTSSVGMFRVDQLAAGEYILTVTRSGFDAETIAVTLDVNAVRSIDVALRPSRVSDTATVVADQPRLDPERTGVATLIRRETIDALPMNGRNALDLSATVPGGSAPVRASNNRLFVPTLGSGVAGLLRIGSTRVTIDGSDAAFVGAAGIGLTVSPDVVDAIHISTSSLDVGTGLTANGAVNLVTRSGSNQGSGRALGFWRDSALAAYPSLSHDPNNPDPSVGRRQVGGFVGGPLKRNRAFGFVDVERTDQQSAVSVIVPAPFAALGGVGSSPFTQTLVTGRLDVALGVGHHVTGESLNDHNHAISPNGTVSTASNWSNTFNINALDQIALTDVLSPTVVNDLRMSYVRTWSPEAPASAADCLAIGLSCEGIGGPEVRVADSAASPALLQMGPFRTLALSAHRTELLDTLTWQRGAHRLRGGVDWERSVARAATDDRDPALITVFTPATAGANVTVPDVYMSEGDVLKLPFQSAQVSVGPAAYLERGSNAVRVFDSYRGFVEDTWTLARRVTLSASLAASDEPNVLNTDLAKPILLENFVGGVDGLAPPRIHVEWAPAGGLTWALTHDARTIVRVSAGRFVDPAASANAMSIESERQALSPLGTGRLVVTPVDANGSLLRFATPTSLTGQGFVDDLSTIREKLAQLFASSDSSALNINLAKAASDLSAADYTQPAAIHGNLGIERAVGRTLIVGADGVYRHFSHVVIPGIDEELFGSLSAPLTTCRGSAIIDVSAPCARGPITFDVTAGHARALALLVHVDQHLPRLQYSVAYTLSSYRGTNGTGAGTGFNNFNWGVNTGPLPSDRRHMLNVSGRLSLPWRLELGFNMAAASAPPFSAYLGNVDLNGDGTANDLLPGSTVGAFGRNLNRVDLMTLVHAYNQNLPAGASPIRLPASFAFGDTFCTIDLRLARTFGPSTGRFRIEAIAEVFNVLNTRNYTGYDGNLLGPTFGQPTALASQAFGSGGPRAGQFGFRLTF
jgi:hypothetical protein